MEVSESLDIIEDQPRQGDNHQNYEGYWDEENWSSVKEEKIEFINFIIYNESLLQINFSFYFDFPVDRE